MLKSLRSRLILSFLVVIFLTLCVAGAVLLVFIQPYENARLTQRLVAALGPAAIQARTLTLAGQTPAEIVPQLQDEFDDPNWRLIWINEQRVVLADSKNELAGRVLPAAASTVTTSTARRFVTGSINLTGRNYSYCTAPVIARAGDVRGTLILLGQSRPLLNALEDLAAPLAWAGAIALVVAVLIGLLLARSISGPLNRLTRATEEIARGNFEAQVPTGGDDEVGRLATSFSAMTQAVRRSQQTERDFIANMSHELKTPLTSIQGFAQAIAEGAFTDLEGARNAAKLIFEESQRMARLVGDLLTLSRLNSGQTSVAHERLDLAAMLPTWVNRFQSRAQQAGLTLDLALQSPLTILGDATRLEQVVANLLDNAIKYNRPGGAIKISAGVDRHANSRPGFMLRGPAGERDFALIRVSDTGLGIPAAHLRHVFERFNRADKARVAGGSGLGLAIAKEIVNAHGGEIRVESREGDGTTVSVWLPAVA